MSQELIIDAHVHTFRSPEIGQQAMQGHGQSGCSGTIDELLPLMQRAGIAKSVMLNNTPVLAMREAALERLSRDLPAREMAKAEREQLAEMIGRQSRRNDWTCSVAREHPELVAFIALIPEMGSDGMLDELEDKLAKGARGVKLHPADCSFYPNNPAFWPVYRFCEDRGLPVVAHAGEFGTGVEASRLRFFVPILQAFPRLKLLMAHLGRPDFDEARQIAALYPNACFDTSAAISGSDPEPRVPRGEEVRLIRDIGVERVLFGSDFPWYHPQRDVEYISRLGLSAGERQAILGENAARLYGL